MEGVGCLFDKAKVVIVASDERLLFNSFAQRLVHYEQR